jgi:hypothetical protein
VNNGITDKFIEILNKQAVLYNELEDTIKIESEAIAGKDLKVIDGIVKKEENAIEKIKALEKEKNVLFEGLEERAGFRKNSGAKIKDVLSKLGGGEAAGIEKALAALIDTVKKVDAVNAENVHLLKNFIEYAQFSKILRDKIKEPEQVTYNQSGGKKTEKAQEGPRIDRQI